MRNWSGVSCLCHSSSVFRILSVMSVSLLRVRSLYVKPAISVCSSPDHCVLRVRMLSNSLMVTKVTVDSIVEAVVTPRFEIFYALQALESGSGSHLAGWRSDMQGRIPARIHTALAAIVPSPLMWPLLADALKDEPAKINFPEMMTALREMDEESFQRSVLGGVFKSAG